MSFTRNSHASRLLSPNMSAGVVVWQAEMPDADERLRLVVASGLVCLPLNKGGDWIRLDDRKRKLRAVVDQLATLKADQTTTANKSFALAA